MSIQLIEAGFTVMSHEDRKGAIDIVYQVLGEHMSADWIQTGHVTIEAFKPDADAWAEIERFARVMKEL